MQMAPLQGSPGGLLWGVGRFLYSASKTVLTTPPWFSILGLTLGFFVLCLAVWEGQAV